MSWINYYEQSDVAPSTSLLSAMQAFGVLPPETKFAYDLGCGIGRDAIALAKEGWTVIAIDNCEEAAAFLQQNQSGATLKNIDFRCVSFDAIEWEKCSLVVAHYSLPFCPKEHFETVMECITAHILPNGLFSGVFFGHNDEWMDLVQNTVVELKIFFKDFDVLELTEKEFDMPAVSGQMKHWHVFEVLARKRGG